MSSILFDIVDSDGTDAFVSHLSTLFAQIALPAQRDVVFGAWPVRKYFRLCLKIYGDHMDRAQWLNVTINGVIGADLRSGWSSRDCYIDGRMEVIRVRGSHSRLFEGHDGGFSGKFNPEGPPNHLGYLYPGHFNFQPPST